MAQAPHFFGYGSLVNRGTHCYGDIQRASLPGWRRVWRHATGLGYVALSAEPAAPENVIEGLVASVPQADWTALDCREMGYDRHDISRQCRVEVPLSKIEIYQMRPDLAAVPGPDHPIPLSYLDIVVEGYLEQFGRNGVARFFRTTDGWDAPFLDDRAAPIKARRRQADPSIYPLVDAWLEKIQQRTPHMEPREKSLTRAN